MHHFRLNIDDFQFLAATVIIVSILGMQKVPSIDRKPATANTSRKQPTLQSTSGYQDHLPRERPTQTLLEKLTTLAADQYIARLHYSTYWPPKEFEIEAWA